MLDVIPADFADVLKGTGNRIITTNEDTVTNMVHACIRMVYMRLATGAMVLHRPDPRHHIIKTLLSVLKWSSLKDKDLVLADIWPVDKWVGPCFQGQATIFQDCHTFSPIHWATVTEAIGNNRTLLIGSVCPDKSSDDFVPRAVEVLGGQEYMRLYEWIDI